MRWLINIVYSCWSFIKRSALYLPSIIREWRRGESVTVSSEQEDESVDQGLNAEEGREHTLSGQLQPQPAPQPQPQPAPQPQPQPAPQPQPKPRAQPVPQPKPRAQPVPQPELAVEGETICIRYNQDAKSPTIEDIRDFIALYGSYRQLKVMHTSRLPGIIIEMYEPAVLIDLGFTQFFAALVLALNDYPHIQILDLRSAQGVEKVAFIHFIRQNRYIHTLFLGQQTVSYAASDDYYHWGPLKSAFSAPQPIHTLYIEDKKISGYLLENPLTHRIKRILSNYSRAADSWRYGGYDDERFRSACKVVQDEYAYRFEGAERITRNETRDPWDVANHTERKARFYKCLTWHIEQTAINDSRLKHYLEIKRKFLRLTYDQHLKAMRQAVLAQIKTLDTRVEDSDWEDRVSEIFATHIMHPVFEEMWDQYTACPDRCNPAYLPISFDSSEERWLQKEFEDDAEKSYESFLKLRKAQSGWYYKEKSHTLYLSITWFHPPEIFTWMLCNTAVSKVLIDLSATCYPDEVFIWLERYAPYARHIKSLRLALRGNSAERLSCRHFVQYYKTICDLQLGIVDKDLAKEEDVSYLKDVIEEVRISRHPFVSLRCTANPETVIVSHLVQSCEIVIKRNELEVAEGRKAGYFQTQHLVCLQNFIKKLDMATQYDKVHGPSDRLALYQQASVAFRALCMRRVTLLLSHESNTSCAFSKLPVELLELIFMPVVMSAIEAPQTSKFRGMI